MAFDWVNVGTPFSWCFVAALFVAAGVARASRGDLGSKRWTRTFIYLAFAVALAAGGVFAPGPHRVLDIRLAYFAGATFLVGLLAFRFKLSVGLPLLVLVAAFVTVLGIALRGWTPLEGGSESIATVRVLNAGAREVALEITPSFGSSAQSPVSGTVSAGAIVPVVETLQFKPYYFFLASPVLFRFDAMESDAHTAASSRRLPVARTSGRLVRLVTHLPGIGYRLVVGQRTHGATLESYSVELDRHHTVRMIPSSS